MVACLGGATGAEAEREHNQTREAVQVAFLIRNLPISGPDPQFLKPNSNQEAEIY